MPRCPFDNTEFLGCVCPTCEALDEDGQNKRAYCRWDNISPISENRLYSEFKNI